MSEVYVEYNTGPIPVSPGRKTLRNLLYTSGILLLIYSVLFYPILWTFSLIFFVWGHYYNRNSHYEFEYIILKNELHVDRIVANLKRKKAFRGNLNDIQLFTNQAKILHEYEATQKTPVRIKRFNNPKEKTYALVLKTEKGLICLYLNGNEELVDAIRSQYPRQTKFVSLETDPSKTGDH